VAGCEHRKIDVGPGDVPLGDFSDNIQERRDSAADLPATVAWVEHILPLVRADLMGSRSSTSRRTRSRPRSTPPTTGGSRS
jgi:hypothetical protein